ncbi:hypothetical protein [Clostridium estertheticum]|uniref:Uncharacterized protein n=1 Tax=Clostridium estertheticum TaxID=238834 RepID=A0AA47EMK2_9CLOT|nr:hypothetical protein [Clostridium estertheticum]MBU3153885.1 hypothetical protein [Clostridium estertheticum]WAG61338.1 hypothetical protein LL038_03535 [Clostridium estertheticum]
MLKKFSKKLLMGLMCSSLLICTSMPAFASTTNVTSTKSVKALSTATKLSTSNWQFVSQEQFYYVGGTPSISQTYVGTKGTSSLFWCMSSLWGDKSLNIDPNYTYMVEVAYDYGSGYRGYNSLTGVENITKDTIAYLPATTTSANFIVSKKLK